MENGKMMLLDEVMERLHVTRPFVYRLIDSGELKASKVARRWLVSEEALQDYLQSTQQQKTDCPAHRRKLGLSPDMTLEDMQAKEKGCAWKYLLAQTDEERWRWREEMGKVERLAGRVYGFAAMDATIEAGMAVIRKGSL